MRAALRGARLPLTRAALATLVLALLAGCAGQPPRRDAAPQELAVQAEREARLADRDRWTLHGRIAVSGGGDGGSGQLLWTQTGDDTVFEMRAPVSRQTWRLSASPGVVRLDGLDGGARHGDDAETLLRSELGWNLPLSSLASWVRGMRGDGPARVQFDADGLPALIEQHGWRIEYRAWDRSTDPALPSRVFASRGDQRVRLAVSGWDLLP
jgi:outer membrane lipoprotein LolB